MLYFVFIQTLLFSKRNHLNSSISNIQCTCRKWLQKLFCYYYKKLSDSLDKKKLTIQTKLHDLIASVEIILKHYILQILKSSYCNS